MNKGVFIDLDGTLLNDSKNISAYDQQAIQLVRQQGVKVILVTGKSLFNAIQWHNSLKLDSWLITSMGQVICIPTQPERLPILHFTKSHQALRLIKYIASKVEINNFLFETYDDVVFVQNKQESNLTQLICQNRELQIFEGLELDNIVSTYIEVKCHENLQFMKNFIGELNKVFGLDFEHSFWITDGNYPIIHIKPFQSGKSKAVKEVCALEGIDYTICFGNGWSDRNMLSEADEGYAVANALDKVKSYASHVSVYDNNHSAVGRELNRIFNLKISD